MKKQIHNPLSAGKYRLIAFLLTLFSLSVMAQNTYTFNYTGGQQTISLAAGAYTFECWGADGGNNLGNGGSTYPQNGGKGGYSVGTYTLTSPTTVYVNVGGKGANSISVLNTTVAGGYNGGGYGSANATSGKSSGSGGGGASHIAFASGLLSALSTNTTSIRIVAGGGGGCGESNYANTNTAYNSNGGRGGGLSGFQNVTTSYLGRHGQGGTQTAGGGGGDNGSATAGTPLQGIFGAGGYNPTAGTNSSAGGSGAGGGGGGWFGGGAGWVATGTGFQTGAGGGGSGYIGGVSNGTTAALNTTGYVANPDITGNGLVRIIEACSFYLGTSTGNSVNPVICAGQSLTLTTNAISNYSWSTGATTSSIIVSPTSNTVYALTATSASNCTTTRNLSITVSSGQPTLAVVSSTNQICSGQSVTITATGAVTYTFTNPGITNGISFSPTATAVYTINGQNGCGIVTATTAITVAPIQITVSTTSTLLCEGKPATLTAVSPVNNYTWTPVNISGSTAIVAPTSNMVYTVFGTDGTCSGTQTLAINTNPNPTITVVSSASVICAGQTVSMSATGANSYTWTPGNMTGSQIMASPPSTTLFVVTGENTFGCTSIQNQVVLVNAAPVINISVNPGLVCAGQSATLLASGAANYVWTGGPSTSSFVTTVNATTVFTVTGSHSTNTCTAEQTATVGAIVPNLTLPTNTSVCAGKTLTVYATGADDYSWNSISTGSVGVFAMQPAQNQTVTLIATTSSMSVNCPVTHTFEININPLPTLSITPSRLTICKNESNTLTVSGAQNYTWSSGSSSSTLLITPTAGQTFSVLGIDSKGCENTKLYQAVVNPCLGLNEAGNNLASLMVYPNPSQGQITLQSDKAMVLSISNALGQQIQTIRLREESGFKFQLTDLAAGIYFIGEVNGTSKNAIKVIVQ
jgi:hypothetical protein